MTARGIVPTIRSFVATAVLCAGPAAAQTIPPELTSQDPAAYIHVTSSADADMLRGEIIRRIFKRPDLDASRLPDVREEGYGIPRYEGVEGLRSISRWRIRLAYGFESVVTHFAAGDGRAAVLYHAGHGETCAERESLVRRFVGAGYTLACLDMPLHGVNGGPRVVRHTLGALVLASHDDLHLLETPDFSPLSLFLTPVLATVNQLRAQGAETVAMFGFSGGGWTTDFYAAIDKRVGPSVSVAGSLPFFARGWAPPAIAVSNGDYEQRLPGLRDIVDYLDLYLLAGHRSSHSNVYIPLDDCCFGGRIAEHWSGMLSKRATAIGGVYEVLYDPTGKTHDLSAWALERVFERIASRR